MDRTTVEWVCAVYPERVKGLFRQINLERPGLEEVKAAAARDDAISAAKALLEYYRTGPSGRWLRWADLPKPGEARDEQADAILDDTFTYYGQTDRVPRMPDGSLKWTHRGPSGDWEWTLTLNRHHHLACLLDAYRRTGNGKYAARIDAHLRDWIPASLPYPARANVGELWRGLEISFRAKAWARVFYALQQDSHLSPAARLLVLTSLPEHADHLRRFHASHNNWTTMEISGLGMVAAAWPEYREAPEWLAYASDTLARELSAQVYPDGAQHELTHHYHWVALANVEQFAAICRGAGIDLTAEYRAGLERMWHYLAAVLRPDGCGSLNNDSDLINFRHSVREAAETYGRPDWAYIAANGAAGEKPAYGPSLVFPWAGQLVIRSGWDADALWAFFDAGPWGTHHQHNDKLHVSLAAYGRDLLVDSGRFVYTGKDVRFLNKYARLSRAHNLVLIDGKGQKPGPRLATEPLADKNHRVSPEMTFARGTCDHFEAEGRAVHTRVVIHLPGNLIVVADRIQTDRPRKLQALWHWHPRCQVAVDGKTIVSTNADAGNLRIAPVAGFDWSVEQVKGQETPDIQGWYSRMYNEWEPNTATVLTADVPGTTAFAWLLLPARGEAGLIEGEMTGNTDDGMAIRIRQPGADATILTIPWHSVQPTKRKEHVMTAHVNMISMTLGSPVTVALAPPEVTKWGPYQFPGLARLSDGRIQVSFHVEADSATAYGLPPARAVSADEGLTWTMQPRENAGEGVAMAWQTPPLLLPNGDRIASRQLRSRPVSDFTLPERPALSVQSYGQRHDYYRLEDLPANAAGGWMLNRQQAGQPAPEPEQAVVRLPGALRCATSGVLTFPWFHEMFLAPDGAVWSVNYDHRIADDRPQDKICAKILRSTDHARSFDLWSEIPYAPDRAADPKADKRDGFTEPTVCFMPDGSVFCLLRTTDGNGVGPMYWARSTDNGRTWTKPAVFDDLGVWPQMLTLKNGVTLVVYGRPGLYLRATTDPAGLRWGERVTVVPPGKVGADTCSYAALLPLADDTALVAYSEFNLPGADGRPCKGMRVRSVRVERK